MNLKPVYQNAPSGSGNTIGGAPPMSDEVVASHVTSAKAAAEAELATLTATLEAECAQCERDRHRGLGTDGRAIEPLVGRITAVEARIAYLTAALEGLGVPQVSELEARVATLEDTVAGLV